MRYFITVYRNENGSLQNVFLLAKQEIPGLVNGDFNCQMEVELGRGRGTEMFPFVENMTEGDLVEIQIKPLKYICQTITFTEKPFEGE